MTKEELVEFYKTMPEDDKKHFDTMFDINNIDCGIKSLNPQLQMLVSMSHYTFSPRCLVHFKREMEEISDDNYFKYMYKLLCVSTHSETKDLLVNYEALYEDESKGIKLYHICSRPIEMFISKVDTKKYPNIKQKYRFELVQLTKDDKYVTKEGIIKNKPRKSKNSFRADPKLDAEFGRFVSYLRNYVKGFPNEKIERYFNGYINRMEKIKKITIEKNAEWEGDLE